MKAIERRVSALFGHLSSVLRALSTDIQPKDVHHLRTTARRLESALQFFRPDLTRKQRDTVRTVDRLLRRAGKIRDCDVQIGLLDEIANGSTRGDRMVVARALRARRTRQALRLGASAKDYCVSKSPERLRKVAAKLRSEIADLSPSQPLDEARFKLVALQQSVKPKDLQTPKGLHAMRLKLKQIRYLAELAQPSAVQRTFLESLKAVQDAIGRWHDWQSLLAFASKRLSQRPKCSLLMEIDTLRSSHQQTAFSAVTRLFEQLPLAGKKDAASVSVSAAQPMKTVS